MSKKAFDIRINEALTTAHRINPDIENFLRYCLFDGKYSHFASNGAGTRDPAHDLTESQAAISDAVSLGEKKLGVAAKRKRDVRRLILLLHSPIVCARATGLDVLSVAEPIRLLGETALEAYLGEAWGKMVVAEGVEWISKNMTDLQHVIVQQMFDARLPTHKEALRALCRSGLFQGADARQFYLAQLRVVVLLCELLSRPDASTLAALKVDVVNMGHDRLKRELVARRNAVGTARRVFVDLLPDNVDAQDRLVAMTTTKVNFFKTTSVHPQDGSIVVPSDTFTVVPVPPAARVKTLGFIPRATVEIGALDLVELDSTTRGTSVYFLPWYPNYITKMTIPANAGPSIFFTAAINGCSVFITGTAQNPTVYHGGLSAIMATAYQGDVVGVANAATAGDSALFWRLLLMHLENIQETDILGEANRDQYVKDPMTPVMSALKPTEFSTPHVRLFEQNIGVTMPGAQVLQCSPWGCVFGIRTDGDWAFYLQENVSLTYLRNNTAEAYKTCRPVYLSRIFPVAARANHVMQHDATNVANHDIFTPSLLVKRL